MLNLERANAIDVFNDEMARLKAQLEVMADHFESTSSLFDGNTYAHFTYSLLAAVERLEEATTAMKGGREMMNKDKLTQVNATLWQAYTLLHFLTRADLNHDDLSDMTTAIAGVKALMESGLDLLDEV